MLNIQKENIENISTKIKEIDDEKSNMWTWSNMPLLLHAFQLVFFGYLIVRCINCSRSQKLCAPQLENIGHLEPKI